MNKQGPRTFKEGEEQQHHHQSHQGIEVVPNDQATHWTTSTFAPSFITNLYPQDWILQDNATPKYSQISPFDQQLEQRVHMYGASSAVIPHSTETTKISSPHFKIQDSSVSHSERRSAANRSSLMMSGLGHENMDRNQYIQAADVSTCHAYDSDSYLDVHYTVDTGDHMAYEKEDVYMASIDEIHWKFSVGNLAGPRPSMGIYQLGVNRLSTTEAPSRIVVGTLDPVQAPRVPRNTQTSLPAAEQDEAVPKYFRQLIPPHNPRLKWKPQWREMDGIYIKPQPFDMLAGSRPFESYCDQFIVNESEPESRRAATKPPYSNATTFHPALSSSPGTYVSYTNGTDEGTTSKPTGQALVDWSPLAQSESFVEELESTTRLDDSTNMEETGQLKLGNSGSYWMHGFHG